MNLDNDSGGPAYGPVHTEAARRTCTTGQAAALLGVSARTLQNYIRSGKCPNKPALHYARRLKFYVWTPALIEEYRSAIAAARA